MTVEKIIRKWQKPPKQQVKWEKDNSSLDSPDEPFQYTFRDLIFQVCKFKKKQNRQRKKTIAYMPPLPTLP